MPDHDLMFFPDDKPTRADAARNRDLLLTTARTLFSQQGVAQVTMSAIASSAGVGKGTLYRHFSDKAELCHALLDHEMRGLQTETLRHLRWRGDAADKLKWFLEQAVRFVDENRDLLCEASSHGQTSLLQHPAHLWWRQTILGLLREMAPAGDIDYMTDTLYIMLDAQTLNFQRDALGYSHARIVSGLHNLVDNFASHLR